MQMQRLPAKKRPDALAQRCGEHPCPPTGCRHDDAEKPWRSPLGGPKVDAVPAIVCDALRAPGRPLDMDLTDEMGARFGFDFSAVRVHDDATASRSALAVHAAAYTVGTQVVFGAGQYRPDTTAGRLVILHELTHVVQQSGQNQNAGGGGGGHLAVTDPGDAAEREAVAVRLTQGHPTVAIGAPLMVARSGSGDVPPQPLRHLGLTAAEVARLNEVRSRLVPAGERSTAIVGVLIAEDGRAFEFRSGGGQGFSSHVEGKATATMRSEGIKRATLLVELVPCQVCDRSWYDQSTGPEEPLRSSRTGRPIARQTAKVNTALPTDTRLTVVDPGGATTYWGTRPVPTAVTPPSGSGKRPAPGPTAEPKAPPVRTRPAAEAVSEVSGPRPGPALAAPGPAGRARPGTTTGGAAARAITSELAESLRTDLRLLRATSVLRTTLAALQGAGAILEAVQAVSMARSKLAGQGFILSALIGQAESAEQAADDSLREYERHSDALNPLSFKLAAALLEPRAAASAYWSLLGLSGPTTRVSVALGDDLPRFRMARDEAAAKEQYARALLNDRRSLTALGVLGMGSSILVQVFALSEDWQEIRGALTGAVSRYEDLQRRVDADVAFFNEWGTALVATCEKGSLFGLCVGGPE